MDREQALGVSGPTLPEGLADSSCWYVLFALSLPPGHWVTGLSLSLPPGERPEPTARPPSPSYFCIVFSACSCSLSVYSVTECMFLHVTVLVVMFMVSQGSTQSLPHERAHATEPMDRQTRQMLSSPATGRSRTTWPARSRGSGCTTPASTPPLRSASRRISEPAAPQGLP